MFVLFRKSLLLASGCLAIWGSLSQCLPAVEQGLASLLTVVSQQQAEEKKDKEPDPAEETGEDTEKSTDADSKDMEKKESKSADPEEIQKEEKKTKEKDSEAKKETKSDDEKADEPADKKVEEKVEESKKEEKEKKKPFTVESKPLKIEQTLEGIFVATEMDEVALRPDTWARYTVVEAVEHGKEVKKGDVLVRFDDEDIEERLADETIDQRLSELSLMQAEEEAPRTEKLLKLAYESAKRTYDHLAEDHKYYL